MTTALQFQRDLYGPLTALTHFRAKRALSVSNPFRKKIPSASTKTSGLFGFFFDQPPVEKTRSTSADLRKLAQEEKTLHQEIHHILTKKINDYLMCYLFETMRMIQVDYGTADFTQYKPLELLQVSIKFVMTKHSIIAYLQEQFAALSDLLTKLIHLYEQASLPAEAGTVREMQNRIHPIQQQMIDRYTQEFERYLNRLNEAVESSSTDFSLEAIGPVPDEWKSATFIEDVQKRYEKLSQAR